MTKAVRKITTIEDMYHFWYIPMFMPYTFEAQEIFATYTEEEKEHGRVVEIDDEIWEKWHSMRKVEGEKMNDGIKVFMSKYTPGLKSGKGVHFKKGEYVQYRLRNGEEHQIMIDSDLMENSGFLGYEAIFDDGIRAFAVEDQIYDWEGKAK